MPTAGADADAPGNDAPRGEVPEAPGTEVPWAAEAAGVEVPKAEGDARAGDPRAPWDTAAKVPGTAWGAGVDVPAPAGSVAPDVPGAAVPVAAPADADAASGADAAAGAGGTALAGAAANFWGFARWAKGDIARAIAEALRARQYFSQTRPAGEEPEALAAWCMTVAWLTLAPAVLDCGRAAQGAWTDFRGFLAERGGLPLADRLGREMERIGGSI